jgi:hypothetical protein
MINQHIIYQTLWECQKQSPNKRYLYALVDGLQYERLFKREITEENGILPLFIQPNNQDIAFYGPWL